MYLFVLVLVCFSFEESLSQWVRKKRTIYPRMVIPMGMNVMNRGGYPFIPGYMRPQQGFMKMPKFRKSKKSKSKAPLSPQEQMEQYKQRYILMHEFTLLINKLMFAYTEGERSIYFNQMREIIDMMQKLDHPSARFKKQSKIVMLIVPPEVIEKWAGLPSSSKKPANKITDVLKNLMPNAASYFSMPGTEIYHPHFETHPIHLPAAVSIVPHPLYTPTSPLNFLDGLNHLVYPPNMPAVNPLDMISQMPNPFQPYPIQDNVKVVVQKTEKPTDKKEESKDKKEKGQQKSLDSILDSAFYKSLFGFKK